MGEAWYGQWEEVEDEDFKGYYDHYYGNWEEANAHYDEDDE
jgi:hypothetical protein